MGFHTGARNALRAFTAARARTPEALGAPLGTELFLLTCPIGVAAGDRVAFVTAGRSFGFAAVPSTVHPGARFVVFVRHDDWTSEV